MEKIELKDTYGNLVEVFIKRLDISYIDKIMILQKEVVDNLVDKNFYASTDKGEYIKYIENGAHIVGIVTLEDELIAMGVYVKFGYGEHNYGYDLDIKDEELLSVGQIESTVVKNEYRGNGLQRILCIKLEEVAKQDNIRTLAATVAPKNSCSLNNFKKLGYTVEKEKLKYGNYLRYILKKELEQYD